MWIDKINNKKIKKPYKLDNQPNQVWEDESTLNSLGIYKANVINSTESKRYYIISENIDYETATVTYTETPKDLDEIKRLMNISIKERFQEKLDHAEVPTSLGYSVDGGYISVKNFEIGKKHNIPKVKDYDNNFHDVQESDYDTIISEIELYGITLYNQKWSVQAEVQALQDINACKLFEHEPYDYTLTEDDITELDGTQKVGDVVTRYKNNCKDW